MIFRFLNYLKENNIDFCIINGYENTGKDIESDNDILFRKKYFKKIEEIIEDFCKKNNFLYIQNFHHDIYAKNIFIFDAKSQILNLDLYGELSRKGVIFFEEKEIFDNLEYYESLPILSVEKEFIYYLYKKLDKKDLDKNVFLYLNKLWNKNPEKVKKTIREKFNNTGNLIIKSFENKDLNLLISNRKNILNDVKKQVSLKRKLKNYRRIIKRIINSTGFSVAFLGPDGSGKSTIIKKLINSNLPFRREDYFHLKPIKVFTSNRTSTKDPHKYHKYTPLISYIKLIYFLFQYNYGWFKYIWPLKIRSSLVVFDRYYDDLLVDTKRYRYGGSVDIAKFVRNFIPKPDLYFVLVTDPEIIFERKKEVPLFEIKNQVKKYEELVDDKKYIKIDVSKSPDENVYFIIKKILEKMNEKYK